MRDGATHIARPFIELLRDPSPGHEGAFTVPEARHRGVPAIEELVERLHKVLGPGTLNWRMCENKVGVVLWQWELQPHG